MTRYPLNRCPVCGARIYSTEPVGQSPGGVRCFNCKPGERGIDR